LFLKDLISSVSEQVGDVSKEKLRVYIQNCVSRNIIAPVGRQGRRNVYTVDTVKQVVQLWKNRQTKLGLSAQRMFIGLHVPLEYYDRFGHMALQNKLVVSVTHYYNFGFVVEILGDWDDAHCFLDDIQDRVPASLLNFDIGMFQLLGDSTDPMNGKNENETCFSVLILIQAIFNRDRLALTLEGFCARNLKFKMTELRVGRWDFMLVAKIHSPLEIDYFEMALLSVRYMVGATRVLIASPTYSSVR
jgi:hypothetical protein